MIGNRMGEPHVWPIIQVYILLLDIHHFFSCLTGELGFLWICCVKLLYQTFSLLTIMWLNSVEILEDAYKEVRCMMGSKQDRQKELYVRARHGEPFQCGDLVLLHSPVVSRGYAKKLHCPWDGP